MPTKQITAGHVLIVEFPARVKTIERSLGPGYDATAGDGHVRGVRPGSHRILGHVAA